MNGFYKELTKKTTVAGKATQETHTITEGHAYDQEYLTQVILRIPN